MLYLKIDPTTNIATDLTNVDDRDRNVESRWDWKEFHHAERRAEELTEATGTLFIATDAGKWCSPQFDVVAGFKVGDKVSSGFNGDASPCGEIVSISKTMKKITVSGGESFYRRRQTGSWLAHGTWSLMQGHYSERNPHI